MPYKNPADKKAWNARDKQQNPERHKEYQRRAYAKAKAHRPVVAKAPKPIITTKQKREKSRRSYRRLKALAHQRLGKKCVKCGEDDPIVLHIDHIEPLLRGSLGISNKGSNMSYHTYKEVIAIDSPGDKYQLLCANCHARKCHEERHLYAQGAGYSDECVDDQLIDETDQTGEQLCLL